MPELLTSDEPVSAQTVPERRRAQIVATAVRLFSEHGYFQTTIEDIANAIPVSKGLVYKYFKDKDALLFFCMRYVLDKYNLDDVPQLISKIGPLGALLAVMRIQCSIAQEHRLETTLAYRSTADLSAELSRKIKVLESKTVRIIRQCLDSCIRQGLMSEINTDIMAYQYLMYGHTWALKNWAFRDRYTADEYMSEGRNLLLEPFLTELGRAELGQCEAEGISICSPSHDPGSC
jgi:AcrR family transcriptional regulator